MNIKGKKISIVGAVRSGVAAAKLCKRHGAIPYVSDYSPADKIPDSVEVLKSSGIDYETGGHSDKVYDCDLLVTSPGVPSDAPVLKNAIAKGIEVISELEFAFRFYKGTIIAITGTNGKTTTTSLMAFVLEKCGKKVYTAGNIGFAFSEIADRAEEESFVSLEISSFQLDFINSFKPRYSMILNITPDHLDRYENSFDNYRNSKYGITRYQSSDDIFIYNSDDTKSEIEKINSKASLRTFSLNEKVANGAYFDGENLVIANGGKVTPVMSKQEASLKGEHNIYNMLAVLTVAADLNLDLDKVKAAMREFPGVEHRLEFVRELDGVKYVNDSKATNVDSVWYALRTFDEPLLLILGGKDKGNDYNEIKEPVEKHVRKIYAIGSSKDKVYDYFNSFIEVEKVDTMEDCVLKCKKDAKSGEVVLLSPACASFDMFKSYEHRGKVFKQAVNQL
ncbi:MAG: UDP-N-acetylmuramoylalanine--D-glutamate ligase [Melioribacteraceae bacterium]|nr:MAG: UDP-N-acetylmuramoylalanine--D-glutamate ligase [Melioribacteraceae bacterium]